MGRALDFSKDVVTCSFVLVTTHVKQVLARFLVLPSVISTIQNYNAKCFLVLASKKCLCKQLHMYMCSHVKLHEVKEKLA